MLWLIGDKGMLGTELARLLEKREIPFAGTDREVDITDPAALAAFAASIRETPAWIINCAAYTAVDRAEDDGEACRRLNVLGAANIAKAAGDCGARLIHISTDYVFDGKGVYDESLRGPRPYREDDETNPIGVYGLAKRDGENAVMENSKNAYIIRTAWLYGRYGANFVHTMLRLMKERDTVKVVNDQRGSPTWAFDLASAVLTLVNAVNGGEKVPFGIYHYTNEGNISWFDFAREIYSQGRRLGLLPKDCTVQPCTSAEFPARVTRPEYSALDKAKIRAALGLAIPEWNKSLEKYLAEMN
ncbi:MAG: dTDP-4-dehydrorhamnose reductase [Treponema sp.]|jgi:dTDP-4-dehydrorhamnose reductase|nr:dTDP-4-dehydrorhamnose reductase [Treponema sp.]